MDGTKTTDVAAASAFDEVIVNQTVDGQKRTRRASTEVVATVLLGTAAFDGIVGGYAANYELKSQLDADLAHAAGALGRVFGDGANNGVYKKSGASGAGSWARIGNLPEQPNPTELAIRSTGASFDVKLKSTEATLSADRAVTINPGNADRVVSLGGNITTNGSLTTAAGGNITLTPAAGGSAVTLPPSGTLATTAVTDAIQDTRTAANKFDPAQAYTFPGHVNTGGTFDTTLAYSVRTDYLSCPAAGSWIGIDLRSADSRWAIGTATSRFFAFYNDSNVFVASVTKDDGEFYQSDGGRFCAAIVPAGATKMVTNIMFPSTLTPSADEVTRMLGTVQVAHSANALPFEPYVASNTSEVVRSSQFGSITPAITGGVLYKSGTNWYVRTRWDDATHLVQRFTINPQNGRTESSLVDMLGVKLIPASTPHANTVSAFNAASALSLSAQTDDMAPIKINGQYVWAGHAYLVKRCVVTAHGKDNTDVGSTWTDGAAKVWILARIIDANTVEMWAQNTGTATRWVSGGTITGATLTHAAGATHTGAMTITGTPSDSQLWPIAQHYKVGVLIDGKTPVHTDGIYAFETLVIEESGGVPNLKSLQDDIIARVGTNEEPIFNRDSVQTQIEVSTSITINADGFMAVLQGILEVQDAILNYYGGVQAIKLLETGTQTLHGYVPRTSSITVGGTPYDLANVANITAAPSGPITVDSTKWTNANHPPERMAEIVRSAEGVPLWGYVQGVLPFWGQGLPATRKLNTADAMWFETSRKMYLIGIGSRAGTTDTTTANRLVELPCYRGFYNANADQNVIVKGVVDFGGKTYVILDGQAALTSAWVPLPPRLIGKPVAIGYDPDATLTLNSSVVHRRGINVTCAGDFNAILTVG